MIKEYRDFSMGKGTNLPDENMPDKMLKDALNVYWDAGLKKRHGYKEVYDQESGAIVGHHFVEMEGYGVAIIAVLVTTTVKFYSNYSGTMTEIDASFTWTGASVEIGFASLGEKTVLVDKSAGNIPAVIYYDGGMKICTLDSYDVRTIDTPFWFAGQYDYGATNEYIDDTTDAQDAGTDDYSLATTIAKDGFWVASASKFSKVLLTECDKFDGSPDAAYTYYNGTELTTLTVATPAVWTDDKGDKYMEFAIPSDWAVWDGDDAVDSNASTVTGSMKGNYVIRVSFTTAPDSAMDCDKLTVSLTEAVTQALSGEKPTAVCVHNSKVWLASGNSINYSDYGKVTGWQPYLFEYFSDGGAQINAMVSLGDYLCLVKDNALGGIYGTTQENFTVKTVATKGTGNGNSCAVVKGVLFYQSAGIIWVFINGYLLNISKHISDRIQDSGYGIEYNGYWYYVTAGRILLVDPDTIIRDDLGDGMAAFWEWSINAATS